MARIDLIGVTKRFGDTVAVRDLDLSVADGEFFCILGPPSSGKSTILRLLLGLERPDQGEILVDGRNVTPVGPARRNMAMVFQNLALFPHMTAGDNLRFPLVERRLPEARIRERVAAVAEKLHITPLLGKLPAHLSGGERQRVAIGRALVRDPDAYLMDDPISALDARLREEMRIELKRLQRELHHTLVYVTHDQEEAMSVADRMAVLEHGEIRQVGTPDEIYNRPASRYVGALVGSPRMNMVPGRLDGAAFRADAIDLVVPVAAAGASGPALLGVRPEDVAVAPADRDGGAAATVSDVQPLGAYTILDLDAGGLALKAMVPGQAAWAPGTPVRLRADPAKCVLFDTAGGGRLATQPSASG